MFSTAKAVKAAWTNVVILDGMRTPFTDYTGALAAISPTDLGIKAGRAALMKAGVDGGDIDTVVCGNMAQASFDAYFLPRHVGLFCGAPMEVPAHLVQRICGTGIEALSQSADAVGWGRAQVALCVGTESMSRNPMAAYTHRNGFRLGQVEFKDFLWESLYDSIGDVTMGGTAENLAKRYQITREEVDRFAERSFNRALAAQASGFLAGEIVAVTEEVFERDSYLKRGIKMRKGEVVDKDSHVRPSPYESLAKIRPAFGGVQTGGNSSGMVDGAAALVLASDDYAKAKGKKPLARVLGAAAVGVPPELMGIGPAPAIAAVVEQAGLKIADIDRIEINEAFGAQVLACVRELGLDEDKLNVNGGAIAIGHPLGATGTRITLTLARELQRSGKRYGVSSACIGGGQGIAMLIENPEAAK